MRFLVVIACVFFGSVCASSASNSEGDDGDKSGVDTIAETLVIEASDNQVPVQSHAAAPMISEYLARGTNAFKDTLVRVSGPICTYVSTWSASKKSASDDAADLKPTACSLKVRMPTRREIVVYGTPVLVIVTAYGIKMCVDTWPENWVAYGISTASELASCVNGNCNMFGSVTW